MCQNGLLLLFSLSIFTVAAVTGCTIKGGGTKFPSKMSDKMMLDQLVNRTCYDKRIRPSEGTTVINISVLVLSLASPDESSLQYEVEFLVHQRWEDERLHFESRYDGDRQHLNGIHHKEALWLPDTYFLKHGESKQLPTPSDIALRIFRNGTVHYTMRNRLNLQCKGNLNIFPFDHPECFFGIESISHEEHEILFNWSSTLSPLVFVPHYHSLNAYITKNFTKTCDESAGSKEEKRSSWRGNYSCLKVEMIFKRDSTFYYSTVFIPGMLLVSSSFITFWLEWNAVPGRVMLGVTTMLNFFTTSNNFRSGLPVVANLTAMNIWDGVCMCFIYASLIEFVTVNYLARKKPRSIRALCGIIGPRLLEPQKQEEEVTGMGNHDSNDCSMCPPNQCVHSVPIDGLKEMPSARIVAEDYMQPIKLAKTIDVLSRVVFPVAYVVFLIFFFVRFQEHDH